MQDKMKMSKKPDYKKKDEDMQNSMLDGHLLFVLIPILPLAHSLSELENFYGHLLFVLYK